MSEVHSTLMTRDYKFFEAARKAAGESTFKVRVGAVGVYRGRVVASAASLDKTEPLQKFYNRARSFNQVGLCLPKVHAEVSLVKKLTKLNIPMREVKVYVYRICKSREKGLARPCRACILALRDADIRTVYYTTDYGYAKEWINYKEA